MKKLSLLILLSLSLLFVGCGQQCLDSGNNIECYYSINYKEAGIQVWTDIVVKPDYAGNITISNCDSIYSKSIATCSWFQ